MIVVCTAGCREQDLGGQSWTQAAPEPEPWYPNGIRHTIHYEMKETGIMVYIQILHATHGTVTLFLLESCVHAYKFL